MGETMSAGGFARAWLRGLVITGAVVVSAAVSFLALSVILWVFCYSIPMGLLALALVVGLLLGLMTADESDGL
jgi:hypothetical protein